MTMAQHLETRNVIAVLFHFYCMPVQLQVVQRQRPGDSVQRVVRGRAADKAHPQQRLPVESGILICA